VFGRTTNGFVKVSHLLIRKAVISVVLLLGFAALAGWFGRKLPKAFLPDEDQGYLYVQLQLPNAASLQRTDAAMRKVEDVILHTPGVEKATSVMGFSLLSTVFNTYSSFCFVTLKDWSERTKPEEQYAAIKSRLARELGKMPEGVAFSFPPPAIPGVGTAGGVNFVLEDRAGKDLPFFVDNMNKFIAAAKKRPEIATVTTTFLPAVPQVFVKVDREKVLKQGVAISDVYKTLQCFMGGSFVNYFNRFGRQWQVYLEAEGDYRKDETKLDQYFVRNRDGAMVPLSAVATMEHRTGPEFTMRFNLFRAAQLNVAAKAGFSSAQVMAALEEVFAQNMPREMGYDYMAMSYQEKKAQEGISPLAIFGLSLLFVFLVLSALYESWALPFSVLLTVPVAVFGAYAALLSRSMENNVFAQIGLVMLIGLAAKNAILIVEFARSRREHGAGVVEAALEGARVRLRPILMTSFAFVLGCVPLWLASGSGAVARRVMGTAVIGGMLAATLLAVFLIPAMFFLVEKLSGRANRTPRPTHTAPIERLTP
jgi:HAE1 family hydrophobic/amphiphilic exporter-1